MALPSLIAEWTPTAPRAYPRLDEGRRVRDRVDPERVFVSDLARRLRVVTGLRL
ncbi:hypothetical protein ACTWPB_13690 [Nocardia sp. IBHARD005]|uniref:hypothetical protein n=1 Tax=Nocardia sp. IBHARD005 TaxID=3457765 RepID=UPI0040599950